MQATQGSGNRRWSDDERAVALDESLTIAQVADQLGRSISSVRAYRKNQRMKAMKPPGQIAAWTAAELEIAFDMSLTVAEVAARLGRTKSAVAGRRARQAALGREVPPDKHGLSSTYRRFGCRCERCTEASRLYTLERAEKGRPDPSVSKSGQPWSADELAVALDVSVSVADVAVRLDRSEAAILLVRQMHHGQDAEVVVAEKRSQDAERRHRQELKRATTALASTPRRGWTPQEVTIAVDTSLTVAEAATRLGRSFQSVQSLRFRLRDGAPEKPVTTGRPWTEDEIVVAMDKSLSTRQAAMRLGRSIAAIQKQRRAQNERLVPDDVHGTMRGYDSHRCRCTLCRTANRERSREQVALEIARKGREEWRREKRDGARRRNAADSETASRNREPWTQRDVDIALDLSRSAGSVARELGRTRLAVTALRRKHAEAVEREERELAKQQEKGTD